MDSICQALPEDERQALLDLLKSMPDYPCWAATLLTGVGDHDVVYRILRMKILTASGRVVMNRYFDLAGDEKLFERIKEVFRDMVARSQDEALDYKEYIQETGVPRGCVAYEVRKMKQR